MMNVYTSIAVVLATVIVFINGASAESFQCAFLQEKFGSGKPNSATCAMSPEKVFSVKGYAPKTYEHCEVKPVYSYEDLEEVSVDLSEGTVSWTKAIGLTEDAKPIQKKFYLEQGLNEEEANRQVNAPQIERHHVFRIMAHHKSNEKVWVDEITQKLMDSPKLVPKHNLIFGDDIYLFHMYMPESTTEAILLDPGSIKGNSWVNIRFGKCRNLSRGQ